MKYIGWGKRTVRSIIKNRRLPDGTIIGAVRYVWPDEGVWVTTDTFSGEGWLCDPIELESICFGEKPRYPQEKWPRPDDIAHYEPYQYSYMESFVANLPNEGWVTVHSCKRLVLMPEGCVVLDRSIEKDGSVYQVLIVSTSTDNPQPRFNFDESVILYLHQPLPLAA